MAIDPDSVDMQDFDAAAPPAEHDQACDQMTDVRPKRNRSEPARYIHEQEEYARHRAHLTMDTPQTVQEAISDEEWRSAMGDEYNALTANGTWYLTRLPPGRKVIKGKWVFKVKTGANGEETRKKARFVARGFTKKKGVDYEQTYSPVISMTSL